MVDNGYDYTNDDFQGDDYSESPKVEIPGITDKVVNFCYTGMNYPCVMLKEGFTCPQHKLVVLGRMAKMGSHGNKDITLYFENKGELLKLGMLSGVQIKAFYDLVGDENVRVFYEEGFELKGDKKYVLCS